MKGKTRIALITVAVALFAVAIGAAASGVAAQNATIESEDVTVTSISDTGESAITIDADDGVSIANVEVSIDTSVAEITGVQEGADVDSSQNAQTFDVVDQTADSVRIEYNNLQAQANPVQDFELAVVEFNPQSPGSTPIDVAEDSLFDGNQNEYSPVGEQEGSLNVDVDANATVKSDDLALSNSGDTGESAITLDADDGLGIANVEVSVDTSVAEITGVQEGADVDSSQNAQTFDVVDQTADSVRIEYNNIQAQANPVQDFELARVEFEAQTNDGEAAIGVAEDGLFDGSQNEYTLVEEQEGTLSVGADPANYELSNLNPAEATVTEGDAPIDISADVENTGGLAGNQDLELTVENSSGTVFSDTVAGVQVGAGASATETFVDVPAGTLAPGEYDHIVSSDNDTVEGNLTVQAPAFFEVSALNAPGTVEEGEQFDVNATVENTGDVSATQDVEFRLNASGEPLNEAAEVTNETVMLDGGESTTVEFEDLSVGQTGDFDHGIFSDDDSETASITVESAALFTEPLPGFNSPPTNTGDLDPNLFEDVSGDGDGLNPTQAVNLWTELVLNPDDFNDLTQEQIDALDWNGDGQLTPADAVNLWTEQVLAN